MPSSTLENTPEDLKWYAAEHPWLQEEITNLKEELTNCQKLLADARLQNSNIQTKYNVLNIELNKFRENKNKAYEDFADKLENALNERDEFRKRWMDADEIIQTFMRRNKP